MNGTAISFGIFVIVMYCIPMMIALAMERKSLVAISIVNILLGWTFIGWVVALVWACYGDDKPLATSQLATAPQQQDAYDAITRLADLRDRGAITDEEFQQEKTKVLAKNA